MVLTPIIKRLTAAAVAIILGVVSASALLPLDKYTINRKDLPEAAQQMLDEYFPKAKVSMVKVDHHLLKRTDYGTSRNPGAYVKLG